MPEERILALLRRGRRVGKCRPLAAGGLGNAVHDTKWTMEEIEEWKQKVSQASGSARAEARFGEGSEKGLYDNRGPPEFMDQAMQRRCVGCATAELYEYYKTCRRAGSSSR